MSFRASLDFEGKVFDIIKCDYTVKRDVDSKGRPASNLYGALIHFSVESTDDIYLFEKMAAEYQPNTGTITFKKDDEDSSMKELTWENGYIVKLEEGMIRTTEIPMMTHVTVSAQIITIGDAVLEQNWPEM